MYMSYTSSFTHVHHGLKYMDTLMNFIYLCMSIDAWCIFFSIKYKTFEGYNHG